MEVVKDIVSDLCSVHLYTHEACNVFSNSRGWSNVGGKPSS
jgi:hypothetical protein